MRALAVILFALITFCGFARDGFAAEVPATADQYRRELTRVVQQEWGLDGSVAVHAAQIHQESGWRAHVDSPVGAQGLAQFMPTTADWIAEIYPDLGAAAPYSPVWAIRAMVRYDRHILDRLTPWRSPVLAACDAWAFTLSGYNGGPGWVSRDRRLAQNAGADADVWWGNVEHFSNRASWAMRENRHYPRRILLELVPIYIDAGWPGGDPCSE
ncbi:transglycosylase SLT domain-containing protein [Thalassospira sp.]|uniref:transglycosylase SLT domain-containing protein n=1 Tax=Thalassospira sp. TaxID=1912094 RepID=UPI0025DFCD4D|nr:transglycosylase SLT domain-containing protein [Thalassospira sp.]